jgi:hypothetical protein
VRLPRWQRRALRQGLLLSPLKRTQSMDEFRCRLFTCPCPRKSSAVAGPRGRAAILSGVAAVLLMLLGRQFLGRLPAGGRSAVRPGGDGLA